MGVIALASLILYLNWKNEVVDNVEIMIFICAGGAMLLLALSLFLIASRISKPIKLLKDQALAIAAGNYGKSIQTEGPREIVELANTLNIMSECLEEQIARLQDSAQARERNYGERECCFLLQYQMLGRTLETYQGNLAAFKSLSILSDQPQGLLLHMQAAPESIQLKMTETSQKGFQGMYALLTKSIPADHFFTLELHSDGCMHYQSKGFPPPFIWSTINASPKQQDENLQPGDFLFLFNTGFTKLFDASSSISAWFARVLRHFASEGLDTCSAVLDKELNFATRKSHPEDDIHLICIQINTKDPAKC